MKDPSIHSASERKSEVYFFVGRWRVGNRPLKEIMFLKIPLEVLGKSFRGIFGFSQFGAWNILGIKSGE